MHELRSVFESQPSQSALAYEGRVVTYGQLDAEARRRAGRLRERGVEPGDRVALYTGNKIPFLFAQLGVLYAGACPLPLNPRFTREEMRYFLSDSEARMVIAGAEELPLVAALRPSCRGRPLCKPTSTTAPPARSASRTSPPTLRG